MDRVLVVEDDEDSRRLIAYALARGGYEVVEARTGAQGAELALDGPFSFIVMDIDLPALDGFEATRRIRGAEASRGTPVIAITSYAMSGDRDRIFAAGCSGYFEKPIDPLTIVEDIRALLGRVGGPG
jgi:two-component system, cell cycle response regulator DivK